MTTQIAGGTVHPMPTHLKKALAAHPKSLAAWQTLTPLARNEWICWVTGAKLKETRDDHLQRTIQELQEGKRRPCCWLGCIHRTDKKLSPSVRAVLAKQKRSS